MKRLVSMLLFAIFLTVPFAAFAQEATLTLKLKRDWGYGGLDGQIQGTFSLHATGPENLVEVRFLLDGSVVNVDTTPPFRYQFRTDQFPPGPHTLSAVGVLSDGTQIAGPEYRRVFLTNQEARQKIVWIIVLMLSVIGGVTLLSMLSSLALERKRPRRPGQYGIAGGAVCPHCGLPFARNVLAPNLVTGKLARCPHCRKWTIAPRASKSALEAAEARLAQEATLAKIAPLTEEEKLKRLLDESRFDN